MTDAHALGRSGEEAAAAYLKKKKFRLVCRGFRFQRGEIDIVAYDGDTLVFVEVKTRSAAGFGPPEESVTSLKQSQLRRLAEAYLMLHNLGDIPCRFDILALSPEGDRGYRIHHIPDAF